MSIFSLTVFGSGRGGGGSKEWTDAYRPAEGILNQPALFKLEERRRMSRLIQLGDIHHFEELEIRLREAFDLDDFDKLFMFGTFQDRIDSLESLSAYLNKPGVERDRARDAVIVHLFIDNPESERASSDISPDSVIAFNFDPDASVETPRLFRAMPAIRAVQGLRPVQLRVVQDNPAQNMNVEQRVKFKMVNRGKHVRIDLSIFPDIESLYHQLKDDFELSPESVLTILDSDKNAIVSLEALRVYADNIPPTRGALRPPVIYVDVQ